MFKAVSLFGRKKTTRPFKDYYVEWIETLKNTLLPLLRQSMSSVYLSRRLLSAHVEMIHRHFQAYFDALDLAASHDVAQLLYPDWRNPIEKPFLWLGDFHPYIYINLLRSFLDGDDDSDDGDSGGGGIQIGEGCELFDRPWNVVMAWKSPSRVLMARIDQIERGLRLLVPALVVRVRDVQAGFVARVAVDWGEGEKEGVKERLGEAMRAQMEEMRGVFVDANRLRRSVLAEIMAAINVHQAAVFLEGLAQFLVGFWDHELLGEFKRCKMPIN
ncbi:protein INAPERTURATE POLLEN1 [Cornus florida]|uniref:protein INAPERTURATE POLLEN1 n=1 Tax=Cornus florida TaxID=4283 RepID=UPI00289DAB98|nr:protein INAPERTURATE POLLEN1 [Cornus florida]